MQNISIIFSYCQNQIVLLALRHNYILRNGIYSLGLLQWYPKVLRGASPYPVRALRELRPGAKRDWVALPSHLLWGLTWAPPYPHIFPKVLPHLPKRVHPQFGNHWPIASSLVLLLQMWFEIALLKKPANSQKCGSG